MTAPALAAVVAVGLLAILTVAGLTRRDRPARSICPTCRSTSCAGQRLALSAATREVRLRRWTAPDDASALTTTEVTR